MSGAGKPDEHYHVNISFPKYKQAMVTLQGMAVHRFSNNNEDDSLACLYKCKFVFDKKKKIGKYTAKLIILCYDNFGENHTPLQRNGITAIPNIVLFPVNFLQVMLQNNVRKKIPLYILDYLRFMFTILGFLKKYINC